MNKFIWKTRSMISLEMHVSFFVFCWLSDPVITSEGYLYDREAILEFIVKQKLDIAKKQKEFERQQKEKQDEEMKPPQSKKSKQNAPNDNDDKPSLPSFWIPSLTPQVSNKFHYYYRRLSFLNWCKSIINSNSIPIAGIENVFCSSEGT